MVNKRLGKQLIFRAGIVECLFMCSGIEVAEKQIYPDKNQGVISSDRSDMISPCRGFQFERGGVAISDSLNGNGKVGKMIRSQVAYRRASPLV